MDAKEFHKYFSWCVGNGITIYPRPIVPNGSVLKIVVNSNGTEKVGEEKFTDNKIYDKIRELYKLIFNKHNNTNETKST